MRIAYLALVELDIANACLIHTRETSEQLAAMGHEMTMILPRPLRMQTWAGVHHTWVRWWGFDRPRQLAFFTDSARQLIQMHRRRSFDILYVREFVRHPFLPQLVQWLRLPLFVEVNGWMLDDFRLAGASSRVLRAIARSQRKLFQAATGIIASTAGNAAKVVSHYGIPSQRVLVQELGTNTEHFTPGDQTRARRVLGLPPEARIILFAGSFHPHHDLGMLVDAFARLASERADLVLMLVGQGAEWKRIRQRLESSGVMGQVRMFDARPYDEIPLYFQAADIGVLPLTIQKVRQQNGALATKLWDYMATGLPVVVTDMPDSASYALLKNLACVVPPEDPQAMTNALRDLLSHADLCVRLSAASLDYARKYRTWRQAAVQTVNFILARLSSA